MRRIGAMAALKTQISFVIPMFNEGESIVSFLTILKGFISQNNSYDFEIVLIDDGSKDSSVDLALSVSDLDVSVVSLDKNRGQQYALCTGLRLANGDYIVTMDADGQHPMSMVTEFLENVKKGSYELVQAYQNTRTQGSLLKRLFSRFFWILIPTRSLGTENTNLGDFRIMSKDLVSRINSYSDPKVIRFLVPQLSRKSLYLPFTALKRESGKTKYTISKMLNLAVESFLQVSVLPLRFLAGIGVLGFVATMSYSAYVLFNYFHGATIPGWASVVLLTGFMGSLNLLSVCLLGEYISRIFLRTELTGHPYIVYRGARSVPDRQ